MSTATCPQTPRCCPELPLFCHLYLLLSDLAHL